jgi:hypothetical protein
MSKSGAFLRDSKSKSYLLEESKNIKMMRPPKSPSLHHYAMPCQMPRQMPQKSKTIKKEKLIENLHSETQKSQNRSNSKTGKSRISQTTLEMQLDLLRKIKSRKE